MTEQTGPILRHATFTIEITEDRDGFGISVRDAEGRGFIGFAKTARKALVKAYPFIVQRISRAALLSDVTDKGR